jgi:hypothetical protein
MDDKCHRNATYCENVSFLFRQETLALCKTILTGLPHIRMFLFCLDRRPLPYAGQVSHDCHIL